MPRVSIAPEGETAKRAVRKRAPRRTVARAVSTSRTSARVSRTVVGQENEVLRKAPTSIPQVRKDKSLKSLGVWFLVVVAVIGLAAGIGFSDSGKLDVTAIVNENNQQQTKQVAENQENSGGESEGGSVEIPVQDSVVVPVSTMKGRGVGSKNVTQPEVVAPETATTSSASSTESTQVDGQSETGTDDVTEEESVTDQ